MLAAFLVVIVAAAITFDVLVGGAWQTSLRAEIERNLIQKAELLAHRVESERGGHSLADIAAQEGQAAGARVTIIDSTGKVLADSEANPASMDNFAMRPEFAAALAGKDSGRVEGSISEHLNEAQHAAREAHYDFGRAADSPD